MLTHLRLVKYIYFDHHICYLIQALSIKEPHNFRKYVLALRITMTRIIFLVVFTVLVTAGVKVPGTQGLPLLCGQPLRNPYVAHSGNLQYYTINSRISLYYAVTQPMSCMIIFISVILTGIVDQGGCIHHLFACHVSL